MRGDYFVFQFLVGFFMRLMAAGGKFERFGVKFVPYLEELTLKE